MKKQKDWLDQHKGQTTTFPLQLGEGEVTCVKRALTPPTQMHAEANVTCTLMHTTVAVDPVSAEVRASCLLWGAPTCITLLHTTNKHVAPPMNNKIRELKNTANM